MLERRVHQHFVDSADLQYQSAESLARPIADAVAALLGALTAGAKVIVCGLGPSAPLAQHLAATLVRSLERERPPLAALALGGEAEAQLLGLALPGDALVLLVPDDESAAAAISLVQAAHGKEATVLALAPRGSALADMLAETDVLIGLPPERASRVLEVQLLALHALADALEIQLMGEPEP